MSVMQPDDDFFCAINSAVESQASNRKKNLKRKRNAEKKKSSTEESDEQPAAKKTKTKSNIITTNADQRKQLATIFHSCVIYNSLFGIKGVYTSVDAATNLFYFYPLVLGPPRDANGNVVKRTKEKGKPIEKAKDYIPAAANPAIIFTMLNKAFSKLFPKLDQNLIRKWDIYRWNIEYYGPKTAALAPSSQTYIASLGNSRPFGGTSALRSVHLVRDTGVSKFERAITITEYFKDLKDKHPVCPVPEDAKTASIDVLYNIKTRTEEQKKSEAEADAEVEKLVTTPEFSNKADFGSDSESDYASESE